MISQENSSISVESTCGLRKHFLHNTNDFDYYSQAKIISFSEPVNVWSILASFITAECATYSSTHAARLKSIRRARSMRNDCHTSNFAQSQVRLPFTITTHSHTTARVYVHNRETDYCYYYVLTGTVAAQNHNMQQKNHWIHWGHAPSLNRKNPTTRHTYVICTYSTLSLLHKNVF